MTRNRIHINTIFINDVVVKYIIENIVSMDANGKKQEEILVNCEFLKNGEVVEKIYNINCAEIPKLYNSEYAKSKAKTMMEKLGGGILC